VIIPHGFCGAQADLWWRMRYADEQQISREVTLLTRRLQTLVAKQAAEMNADQLRAEKELLRISYLRTAESN
jgi:hypothetical protein